MRWLLMIIGALLVATGCTARGTSPTSLVSTPPAAVSDRASPVTSRAADETIQQPIATLTLEVIPVPTDPRAPAINNEVWLNTTPLTQDQLNGKVVLIDFWTFG